jgi:hypothetical protein
MRPGIKVTPAFVIASLALVVVASGGTAYAATKIGSAEIRDNSIRGVDIRSNEVRSSDVRDGALRARDFGPGVLASGPKGEKGDKGDAGATGSNRWLLVDASGAIVAQSGGFSIASAYDNAPLTPAGAVGNVYINANENLSDNGIAVTIALQNKVEQDAPGTPGAGNLNGRAAAADANPEFSGEITSTVCGILNVVACAPAGTDNRNHFVVSPRLSDGQVTTATPVNNRKRFYVTISGDSTDLTDAGKAIPAVALPTPAP